MRNERITWRGIALVLCGIVALAGTARAQTPDTPAAPRFSVGPLLLYPRLEMREIGIDDNVFNDAENPQRDFTMSITPRLSGDMRNGRVRTTFVTFLDYVYFQEFESERSLSRSIEGRFETAEGALQPFAMGSMLDANDRVNAEVDARAARRHVMYGGGLRLVFASGTSISLSARRATTNFDEGELFLGVDLSRTMNTRTDTIDATMRVTLTPLTAWTFTGLLQRDRFDADSRRDADSVVGSTALEFNPSALIAGRASVGYRRFTPDDASLPGFTGVIAQVGLIYSYEATRVEGTFEHDLRYSFQEQQPYYVTTAGRLVFRQRVAGPVDVQGIVGSTLLRYRQYAAGETEVRRDRVPLYGGGLGYRLGDTARLGFNVEWSRRRSDREPDREYDRRRIYASLTYGF